MNPIPHVKAFVQNIRNSRRRSPLLASSTVTNGVGVASPSTNGVPDAERSTAVSGARGGSKPDKSRESLPSDRSSGIASSPSAFASSTSHLSTESTVSARRGGQSDTDDGGHHADTKDGASGRGRDGRSARRDPEPEGDVCPFCGMDFKAEAGMIGEDERRKHAESHLGEIPPSDRSLLHTDLNHRRIAEDEYNISIVHSDTSGSGIGVARRINPAPNAAELCPFCGIEWKGRSMSTVERRDHIKWHDGKSSSPDHTTAPLTP